MGLVDAKLRIGIVRGFLKNRGWLVDCVGGIKCWLSQVDMVDKEASAASTSWAESPSAFKLGQFVVVKRRENSSLTICPSEIHEALSWICCPVKNQLLTVVVTSIEDHGYNCSLGKATKKHGMKVFIKKSSDKPIDLSVGQIISVAVDSVKKEAKLILAQAHAMDRFISRKTAQLDVSKLIPGQLLDCRVSVLEHYQESEGADGHNDGLPRKKRARTQHQTAAPAGQSQLERMCESENIKTLTVEVCSAATADVPPYHRHNAELNLLLNKKNADLKFFPYTASQSDDNTRAHNDQLIKTPAFTEFRTESALCRIIAVEEKQIYVSFLPHIVNWFYNDELMTTCLDKLGKVTPPLLLASRKERGCLLVSDWKSSAEGEDRKQHQCALYRCSKKQFLYESDNLWKSQKVGSSSYPEGGKCLEVWLADSYNIITMKKDSFEKVVTAQDAKIGEKVQFEITQVRDEYALGKIVNSPMRCKLPKELITNVATRVIPPKIVRKGAKLTGRIFNVNVTTNSIEITVKGNHLEMDDEIETQKLFKKQGTPDTIMTLVVTALIQNKGLVLRGFGDCSAFLPFHDIRRHEGRSSSDANSGVDEELANQKRYQPGAFLKVRVIRIDSRTHQALASLDLVSPLSDMSFKSQKMLEEDQRRDVGVKFDDLQVGQCLPAVVTNVLPASGVFVKFENSKLSALARPSEVLEDNEEEITLRKGDEVLAKILSIDSTLARVYIGLKSSHFEDLMQEEDEDDAEDVSSKQTHVRHASSQSKVEVESEVGTDAETEVVSDVESEPEVVSDAEDASEAEVVSDVEELADVKDASDSEAVSDVEEVSHSGTEAEAASSQDPDPSMSGQGRVSEGEESDSDLGMGSVSSTCDEDDDDDDRPTPQAPSISVEDKASLAELEKLVLVDGDKIGPWIDLMAFYAGKAAAVLEGSDLEKEKPNKVSKSVSAILDNVANVVYRSMKMIPLEEKEKREDIWRACLNIFIEITSANPDLVNQLENKRLGMLKEALAFNEPNGVWKHILPLYEKKPFLWKEFEAKLAQRMLKNQKDADIWYRWLRICYRREAQDLGPALGSGASRHRRVKNRQVIDNVIARYKAVCGESDDFVIHQAKLEFEYGSSDLGRSMMLTVLEKHPKRTDLWNVLVDAQMKSVQNKSDIQMARQIFSQSIQALTGRKSLKKLKTIFQKYLQFETQHGTANSIKTCQQLALKLVGENDSL